MFSEAYKAITPSRSARGPFDGDVDHPGKKVLHCEGGNVLWGWNSVGGLLNDGEGLVETQHLRGVRIAFRQFSRAVSTERPRVGSLGDCGFQDLHQIFSRFTRKALNSGV